ncbi:MAG: biotin/lipoyl-binding protein [Pseudomonadota bacterium]
MSELEFQVRAPLALLTDEGVRVTVDEWSLRGFEWPEAAGNLPKRGSLLIPFQGVEISFPVNLRNDGKGPFLEFVDLTGRQRETLAVFYRSILSGKMATTGEMITSLDAPVDLVPMGETKEEQETGKAKTAPRSLRAAFSMSAYMLLAVMVFYLLSAGIYGKVATVNVTNARIEAHLLPHISQLGGYVDKVLVEAGDAVAAGDILVRIETPEHENALSEVRERISGLELRLQTLRERADTFAARVSEERALLAMKIDHAPPALAAARREALASFDARIHPQFQTLFETQALVQRELADIEDDLRRLRRERGRLRDAADALHVVAGEAGFVSEVAVVKGQYAARGDIAVIVEGAQPRMARGWLNQKTAAALQVGMQVKMEVSTRTGRRVLDGTIAEISAGIDPGLSPAFGTLLGVTVNDLDETEIRAELAHLMPVAMRVQRNWLTQAHAQLASVTDRVPGW